MEYVLVMNKIYGETNWYLSHFDEITPEVSCGYHFKTFEEAYHFILDNDIVGFHIEEIE